MHPENTKQFKHINHVRLAYVERGVGRPMVFLHGNPSSSFLWRNILGPLSAEYRCIAPDLVGMGDSDKLLGDDPERYSFVAQQRYLDGLLESLQLDEPVILVVHDWGSALGFDFARRYPARVRGIAYMEAITGVRAWEAMPAQARELFRALRSPAGEAMILEQNAFIERLLPLSILRALTPAEHDEYRRPFREPGEARRPTLSWPRQLPIGGEPREICELVERYAAFMAESPMPKLFVNAEPGRLLTGELREACRRWPNQTEVTVSGLHYIQEDSPAEITSAIHDWARRLP
ncbi:MAG TPA: haloalkane dehalogenase [Polyangiaceae bacterium]|nr:haloalkane dehalogenase [Polyangiaceae bacterium]